MHCEFTGERVLTPHAMHSKENYLIYLFHQATYDFARAYTTAAKVLDYGCGSGYGTHALAPACASITGIDISPESIEYCKHNYQAHNLQYLLVQPSHKPLLPFPDAEFDIVLSFQVIEHVHDVPQYLAEIARVLKSGGTFICSTPDRSTRLLPFQRPWNRFHVHEYDAARLQKALRPEFTTVELLRMSGPVAMLLPELHRTARVKWLSLPVTLPGLPESLRQGGLALLKRLARLKTIEPAFHLADYPYRVTDLCIATDALPSVNLIAIGCRP